MRKIIVLVAIFVTNLLGYDALVSPITSKSLALQIIYEGNNKNELKKNIESSLRLNIIKNYIISSNNNMKEVDKIEANRIFVESIITLLKDTINLLSLIDMRININEQSVKNVMIEAIKTFDRTLKQFGITLSNEAHQKIIDTVVSIVLEYAKEGGKLGKEIDTKLFANELAGKITFIIDKTLDLISIANTMYATINLKIFAFYRQVDDVANAFLNEYFNMVMKGKAITLDYFLNHYYYYQGHYYNFYTFKQKTGTNPVFKDKVIQHAQEEALDISKNMASVSGTINNITALYSSLFQNVKEFKTKLQDRIDIRLRQLGINQKILFYMTINDNFEIDSKKGKALTTKYTHKISDLSSVKVYAISNKNYKLDIYPYCGTTEDNFAHKILASYTTKEKVFYKTKECKTYNDEDDGSYNSLAISFNKKLYHLIDYFYMKKRYLNIREEFFNYSFYGQIRNLKIHGIKLNDSKTFSGNYAISAKQANSIIFSLNNYLVDETKKYGEGTHLKDLGFSGSVTYAKLFSNLNVLLEHFYGKDYFKWNDNEIRYPSNESSLPIKNLIKKLRKEAIMKNSSNYVKYLRKLSKAGIIRLDLKYVSNNLNQPITVKKFIKYINRILEF